MIRGWILVGSVLLVSCSGDLGESSGDDDGSGAGNATGSGAGSGTSSGTGAGSTGTGGMAMVPDDPIFETDIKPILESTCGANDEMNCHGAQAYGANPMEACRGWASFKDTALPPSQMGSCAPLGVYDRLIQVAGWTCGPPYATGEITYLVVPCDPDASMMIQKIETPASEQCVASNGMQGEKMPPGVEMDPVKLATLRKWIENGAPTLANPVVDCGP